MSAPIRLRRTILGVALTLFAGATLASSPVNADLDPLVAPRRIADTRPNGETVDNIAQRSGRRAAGSVLNVPVAGRAGLDPDAEIVVLNVTSTESSAAGWFTVFACDEPRPLSSNLNFPAGRNVANTVIARLSSGGTVCVFTSAPTHIVIDVAGSLSPGSFAALDAPVRLVDTRAIGETIDDRFEGTGDLRPGEIRRIRIAGRGGLAPNARNAVLNVTSTGATTGGWFTVYPCSPSVPNSSSLNYAVGVDIANSVVTALDQNGDVCVFSSGSTHLVVDVTGSLASASFTALAEPRRVADTRSFGDTFDGAGRRTGIVPGGTTLSVKVAGRVGVPVGASSVVVNVTSTASSAAGFATIHPQGTDRPNASNLNFAAGQDIANSVIARVGTDGSICIFTSSTTHYVVDVTGYLTGPAPPAFGAGCPGAAAPPVRTFGAAQLYAVNRDILPGRYVLPDARQTASGGQPACGINRLNRIPTFQIRPADVIASLFPAVDGRVMLDILPEDRAVFWNERCGDLTTYTGSTRRSTTITQGSHVVGDHIAAGEYTTPGGTGCFWARLTGFDLAASSVIENNSGPGGEPEPGPQTVTIEAADTGFYTTTACGTWTRVSP